MKSDFFESSSFTPAVPGAQNRRFSRLKGERRDLLRPWWCVRFTKHARNRLRLYKLSRADAEFIVANPLGKEREDDSKWRYLGQIEGNWIRVIVPDDDPNLIVSVHPRRHG